MKSAAILVSLLVLVGLPLRADLPDTSVFLDHILPICKTAPKAPQILSRMKLETAFEVGYQSQTYRCSLQCRNDSNCLMACQAKAGLKSALVYFENHPELSPPCETWTAVCEQKCESHLPSQQCKKICENKSSV